MTLSTTIIVKDPVPAEALFRFGQSLLGDPARQESRHIPPMTAHKFHDHYTQPPQPNGEWANQIGQGLPAIFEVQYGGDGPLVEHFDWLSDEDADSSEWIAHRVGCLKVWMDTTYSYHGPNGGGCGDLHAWLVVQLCTWLEERGARYEWENESGDWFSDLEDIGKLGDPDRGALR